MIAVKDRFLKLTPEEYFIWEQQLLRHEYLNGEVYAMSGGTQNHGRIASNLIFILKGHLRGGGFQVGNSNCRINIFETKDYVYPDVSVTCDERDRTAIQAIQYPCLIVEVLSPSTANYDRGDKFRMYRRNANTSTDNDRQRCQKSLVCKRCTNSSNDRQSSLSAIASQTSSIKGRNKAVLGLALFRRSPTWIN